MAGDMSSLDVLVVEDNPGDARLIEHHLSSPEAERYLETHLTHVETLAEGLEAARGGGHDVVLLDLGLDDSTGLATLERVLDEDLAVPVIVLTGLQNEDVAVEAIQKGAQDYLPKGDLDAGRLVRALRYAVERHEQERALERRTEQMEFFNSVLRHDILNGMNVIHGRSEMMADRLDGEPQRHAETVVDWSDTLIELTRKVQSTLSAVTDESTDTPEAVALEPLLADQVERVRGMEEGVDVTLDCETGVRVLADDLLGDAIGNLMTNAVTHNDGPVSIDVEVTADEETVTVRVADDGDGIDPDRRERIFERDEQGPGSNGSGFGLYFVDSMVSTYSGSIRVEESTDGGAAFVVSLRQA